MKKDTSLRCKFGLIYAVVGIIIAAFDSYVLPVYLTLLPIHGIFLYLSFKTKNVLAIFYCFSLFLSHGIGSILFYLDRENAERIGFNAIGNFDFSYSRLFEAYSYLLVFLLALLFFVSIFKKQYHTNFLPIFIRQQYNIIQLKSSWNLFPIIIVTIIFLTISIWMYNLHIGMIGLRPTQLPFHLTGILFYSRRFLFPLILIGIYIKTKNKSVAVIPLIIYSLIAGITATSKSVSLLILIPLAFINYLNGKRKISYLCIIFSLFAYFVVGQLRLLIYEFDGKIDFMTVITTSLDLSKDNLLFILIKSFTGRLYGLQSTVLSDQYTGLSFNDLCSFYTNKSIVELVPDYVYSLFGIMLPEDKAFGIGLGFTGTMQLLASHNYFYTIIQAFIISVIFSIQNDCVQKIVKIRAHSIYKYISILIILFSFMSFFDGNEMSLIYVSTFIIIIICRIVMNQNKKYKLI